MSEPKKNGRPTKYKPEYDIQAEKLSRKGFIDREMADFFEVSESTFNLWKIEHPSFSESLARGKGFCDEKVERALYNRAIGYEYEEIKTEDSEQYGKKTTITTKRVQDNTAVIFWLKNRRPDKWRDKVDVESNAKITSNIMPVPTAASVEDWENSSAVVHDKNLKNE